MDQLLREKHAPCLCDGNRRGSEVLKKQASQLTFTQAKTFSQMFNSIPIAIKGTFGDKSESARDCIRSSTPRSQVRGRFWPATKARTKPGILRRRG